MNDKNNIILLVGGIVGVIFIGSLFMKNSWDKYKFMIGALASILLGVGTFYKLDEKAKKEGTDKNSKGALAVASLVVIFGVVLTLYFSSRAGHFNWDQPSMESMRMV